MKKRERERLIPTDFAPPAKTLSNLPGSPENTNPVNMRSAGKESTPQIGGKNLYFDGDQRGYYAGLGTDQLDPTQHLPSQMSNMPVGQKLNAGFNYGQQPQPSPSAQEPFEAARQNEVLSAKGLMTHPFLGMTGSPAIIPGAFPGNMAQGQPLMQPMITVDGQNNSKKGAKA